VDQPNLTKGGGSTSSFNNKYNLYLTTKNSAQSTPIPNLYGGGCKVLEQVGNLINLEDDRNELLTLESDLNTGTNVTYSFDPVLMNCKCCGNFLKGGRGEKNPQVWVFTDQNFAPCIPNTSGASCLKIVRMENGNLFSMVDRFLSKYSSSITSTDIVLLASASQLLREGVAGYIDSLLDTANLVAIGPRKGCLVLPAPFILTGTCKDASLLRNIFDFHAWVRIGGIDPDGLLNDAMGAVEHCIRASMEPVVHWSPVHYRLPLKLPSRTLTTTYSEGPANLPGGAGPFNAMTEKLIITSLLNSLITKCAENGLILDCDPYTSIARTNSTKECPTIVIVGGDHAEQTRAALMRRGADVHLVHIPSYRTSAIHAGKVKEGLTKLEVKEDVWLVIQVFDSGLYMAAPREGGLLPPCIRADGTMHVDGDLVLLPKDLQYSLFRQIDADLAAVKHHKVIFMAPLPRYYVGGCCEDTEHVGNRLQEDYQKKMEDGVFAARANIKNFAFRHGYKNSSTISSWGKVKKMQALWENQILLKQEGYDALASAILEAGEELGRKRKLSSTVSGGAAKRQKMAEATGSGGVSVSGGGGEGAGGGGQGGRSSSTSRDGGGSGVVRGTGSGLLRNARQRGGGMQGGRGGLHRGSAPGRGRGGSEARGRGGGNISFTPFHNSGRGCNQGGGQQYHGHLSQHRGWWRGQGGGRRGDWVPRRPRGPWRGDGRL
jgi:hypothetical protein